FAKLLRNLRASFGWMRIAACRWLFLELSKIRISIPSISLMPSLLTVKPATTPSGSAYEHLCHLWLVGCRDGWAVDIFLQPQTLAMSKGRNSFLYMRPFCNNSK